MDEIVIKDIVDFEGFFNDATKAAELVNTLDKGLQSLNKVEVSIKGINGVQSLNKTIEELNAANKNLTTTLINLDKAKKQSNDADLKSAKLQTEQARAAKENAKAKEIESRLTQKLLSEKEKIAKAQAKEQKDLDSLTNDYKQLSLAYNDAALRAKNMGIRFGENHPLTIQAIADAKAYGDQLKRLDAAVGQHTRNVGNYQQATFALTQVIREAPAFANSFATGISAIGNNFPILIEQYKSLSAQVGKFNAFKILAGSLFSFTALLPIAFLLIQSYGKEITSFFKEMFKGKAVIDQTRESQEKLNKAFDSSEYKKAVENVKELTINIDLAKQGLLNKKDVVDQYNKTIGQTTGEVKSLEEAEKALAKNADAYIKMTLYKAAANLALEEAAKKALEIAKKQNQPVTTDDLIHGPDEEKRAAQTLANNSEEYLALTEKYNTAFLAGNKKLADSLNTQREALYNSIVEKNTFKGLRQELTVSENIANDFQRKAAEISKKFKFDFFGDGDKKDKSGDAKKQAEQDRKARFEILKLQLQDEIDFQNAMAENESLPFAVRKKSREQQFEAEKRLIAAERDFELNAEKLSADEKALINEQAQRKEQEARVKSAIDIIAIRHEINDNEGKAVAEMTKFIEGELAKQVTIEQAAAVKRLNARTTGLVSSMNAEIDFIAGQFKRGEKTKEELEAAKQGIENKYRKQSLLSEIQYIEDLLSVSLLYPKQREDLEKQLNAVKSELRKKDFEEFVDFETRKYELQKSFNDKLKDLAQQAYSALFEFSSYAYDNEKNKIQDSIDALEIRKLKQIEVVEQTVASETEKAAQIQIIEIRSAAEKEQLEKKKRKIDEDKQKLGKAHSLLDIAVTSIKEVFKIKAAAAVLASNPVTLPLVPLALAQIPVVLAGAALSAALIAGKPIARFFKGKKKSDSYTGPGFVGDGGISELIERKDGRMEVTPAVPTLTHVQAGDTIYPDAKKKLKEMALIGMYPALQKISDVAHNNRDEVQALRELNGNIKRGFSETNKQLRLNRQPGRKSFNWRDHWAAIEAINNIKKY